MEEKRGCAEELFLEAAPPVLLVMEEAWQEAGRVGRKKEIAFNQASGNLLRVVLHCSVMACERSASAEVARAETCVFHFALGGCPGLTWPVL